MARMMYETKEHLKAERKSADIIEGKWLCLLKKLSYKLIVDFAVVRNDIICGWIEIKNRNITFNHSNKYMISMHKINQARDLSDKTDLPFILVVKFTDGIYFYKDNREKHELRWGGRFATQRDEQDLEPCYYIDTKLFREL